MSAHTHSKLSAVCKLSRIEICSGWKGATVQSVEMQGEIQLNVSPWRKCHTYDITFYVRIPLCYHQPWITVKTASQQLWISWNVEYQLFSHPWLCFNYVSICFESSSHREIIAFKDEEIGGKEIKIVGIWNEFCKHVFMIQKFSIVIYILKFAKKLSFIWFLQAHYIHLRSLRPAFTYSTLSPILIEGVCVWRYTAKWGDNMRKIFQTQCVRSLRTISQKTAALRN